uniref:HIF-2 alpha uPEP n=1 Tax=Homo sapiens TaxID=9606 RepID=A0A1Z2WUC2_HUMAN|nr:HIF-2 alpha uPEP [Homo sapiens]
MVSSARPPTPSDSQHSSHFFFSLKTQKSDSFSREKGTWVPFSPSSFRV